MPRHTIVAIERGGRHAGRVGTITAYSTSGGRRYKVRWRKPDHRAAAKSGFTTRREAVLFLASVEVDMSKGAFVDPTRSRLRLEQWMREWLANRSDLKPSSRERVVGATERDILPTLGAYPLGELTHARCQEWAASLSKRLRPASVRISSRVAHPGRCRDR